MTSPRELDRRAEFFTMLSPKQAAIFQFMEHLATLERAQSEPGNPPVKVIWDDRRSTQDRLTRMMKERSTWLLPLRPDGYAIFGWKIGGFNPTDEDLELDDEAFREKEMEAHARFPEKGHYEIRVFDMGNSIRMIANGGGFENMQPEWSAAIDDISYPIEVMDKHGFEYANPIHKTVFPPQR